MVDIKDDMGGAYFEKPPYLGSEIHASLLQPSAMILDDVRGDYRPSTIIHFGQPFTAINHC